VTHNRHDVLNGDIVATGDFRIKGDRVSSNKTIAKKLYVDQNGAILFNILRGNLEEV
jgi:hypothetical protein